MSWESRFPYLSAKAEKRRLELYQMDLLWLLAKKNYDGLPQPSMIATGKETKDNRTAKQIEIDTLKKLGVWEAVKWKYSA